ncbi:2-polyprenyl-6-methoxyphenol hydroxylase-like FAD-dependent oxidoreductase [Kitasatospora gansuensis]|uniref:2-polyprenyl-6-methoxyphenol hydroxylase-like FAD-dependent oxidoreductase n=1 Tax=Kitasatospora gansuensis TaxID=258050 RepID=A0A7W7WM29_9ACTN|nr:NAD(P)/FAD-dependent oxidoreductase [Kitasatospora gansuensis]MBB4951359.1 2-polyprenyl-6-methoxyphenol hydroxylase-like FAD-dependent oxidoreductase [Kitasatospora gansuensis]
MSPKARTALVIGGGIAGPVAAMALRQAGIEAAVHEAYDHTADGVGGGMTIAPNGQNALDAIGAGDLVRAIGIPVSALGLRSWTGKHLARFAPPARLPSLQFVWRADLYRAIYAEAERRSVPIHHGKRLTGTTDTGSGVTAHFADGTQASADILIGADGIRSTVRSLIDPAAPQPNYAGLVCFGARLDRSGLPSTEGVMYMCFGKRAFFGYQVFDDSSAVWFVNLPHRAPMTVAEAQAIGAEEWMRTLRAAFADDRTPALEMIGRTDPGQLLVTGPMENMPRVANWTRGRMALIGDAAHAASSSSGQGASIAAESAVELARCLRDLPYDQAFAAYEQLRRPRVERIIKLGVRTNSNKTAGPVGRALRDLVMPAAMKLVNPEKMAWQFDHRIDWDAKAAPLT